MFMRSQTIENCKYPFINKFTMNVFVCAHFRQWVKDLEQTVCTYMYVTLNI